MNTNKNMWVVGVIVVALVAVGIWWFMGVQQTVPATTVDTTPVTTTASETSGAGEVTVETSPSTVATIVGQISNGTTFASLFSSTGVQASLSGKGPYTVFVATDGAFSRLAPGTISGMSAAELKRMMQYHVVTKKLDVDAVNSGQVQALSKDTLNFQVDTKKAAVYVNSGYVLHAYKASNGIVYVINSVLIPPTATTN